MIDEIKTLVTKMTLEEKAGLCSGYDFWSTKPIKRLGVPSIKIGRASCRERVCQYV